MSDDIIKLRNEADVKAQIKKLLEVLDIYYFMPLMAGYGRDGIPDFVCCAGGQFFTIEAKYDCTRHRETDGRIKSGAPSPFQKKEMADIRKHGGITLVVDKGNVLILHEVLKTIKYCGYYDPVDVLLGKICKVDNPACKSLYVIE